MKKLPFPWIFAATFLVLGGMIGCIPGMRFTALFCMGLAFLCILHWVLSGWARKSKVGNVCKVIFRYGMIVGFVLILMVEGYLLHRGTEDRSALPADAVIVLGAGVNGENPSLVLQSRITAAREYIYEHPDVTVVLSGGQGPGEDITEAECMRRALEGEGAELILEERSTSTEENLAFSKEILEQRGIDPQNSTIAIITNDFHVTRACMLAGELGYETVFGVGTPVPWWWLQVNYYLREVFALMKDMIF